MKIGTRRLRTPNLPVPSVPKPHGRVWQAFKLVFPLVVIAAGVYLFYNFPAIWDRVRFMIDKPTVGNTALLPNTIRTAGSGIPTGGAECGIKPIPYDAAGNPTRICDNYVYIPRIRVAAPIVYSSNPNEGAIEADLLKGVVHYPGTAEPGQQGNVFLTGHSSYYWWVNTDYRNVFALVPQLVPGDEIVVYRKGIRYSYRVYGTQEVTPGETSVLAPTPDPQLTLSTCVPIGTSYHRAIVHARQTSPDPALAAPADTSRPPATRLPGVR